MMQKKGIIMNIQEILKNKELHPYLLKVRYGLEKESQRVTLAGDLVHTEYPKTLGNRSNHPYIQTDFAETQMELITPVTESIPELFRYLAALHDVTYRSMNEGEMLWPLSMPPALPEKDEDIRIAKLDNFEDVLYRRYLAKTYGRRKQMVSGIHFNFEFADTLIQKMFQLQTEETDYLKFKTDLYLKVTRNYLHYRWLVTYFYGATPLSEANYFTDEAPKEPVRSIRNSDFGYKNFEDVEVTYATIEAYLADINHMVETGKLSEEKEFYAPVRLRGGKKVADLAEAGIRYIELRNIDLNPYELYGISEEQVEFLHVMLLFLLWKEEGAGADEWVAEGDQKNNLVALEHPLKATAYQKEAELFVSELEAFIQEMDLSISESLIPHLKEMIADPAKTLAGRLYTESLATSQKDVAITLGKQYYHQAWEKPYQLAGFRGMELSTQILLFDAIQKGVAVEVLDESDQFLKLKANDKVEYVKNANMTSKDSYVVPLIMANKTVTKKVLDKAGFRVPAGREFDEMNSALAAYPEFAQIGFVVKPKSTNYGLGISIFKDGSSFEDYQEAVKIAFAEDSSILVEEFLPGTEYRFVVFNGETKAIMLRVPANIKGDGIHTIAELVAKKNEDPLRGTHHRSPLELIQLGSIEKLMLKEQGYTVDAIPEKDEVVYLRENSNVSTGGDSIDVTEEIPEAYKAIASKAVEAIGAVICGIDLIIPDVSCPANEKGAYGIIEANFNPAMHMHIYPYQGKSRRLTIDVLELLYPGITK